MSYIYYFLILGLFLTGCVEKIEPDLKENAPKVVIEGLITNQPGPYTVKLSETNSFYTSTPPPGIDNALVIISDNTGAIDTLKNTGDGVYLTNTIKGIIGNTYDLSVFAKGITFHAVSFLPPVTTIDSIFTNYYAEDDFIHKKGYYLAFSAIEPKGRDDYYLWKFYKDGILLNKPSDIQIASDEGIKENIDGLESPYVFQMGDTAKVEMYSLTEAAYNFYDGLNVNLHNDGGFYSSPPANPPSNISGGALGLFQASAVETSVFVVK